MARTKPTVGGWAAPTETDPGALKTTGYSSGVAPASSNFNWLLNRFSEWNDYNKIAANGEYHVNAATGNDTTGDGSSGSPWATIDKALSELPEIGTVIIYLYGAGTDYKTGADVNIYCNVIILNAAAQTATVTFGSYGGGGADNELYSISLINSHFSILTATTTTVEEAQDAAEAWAAGSTVFKLAGDSSVNMYSALDFDDTTTAASGYYTLISSSVTDLIRSELTFNTWSNVDFNTSDGYLFESGGSMCSLQAGPSAFDDETRILYDPEYQNDILHFEFVTAGGAAVLTGGTGGNFTLGFGGSWNSGSGAYVSTQSTATIAYNANAATIQAAISGVSNLFMTCKSLDLTANSGAILNFDAEIYGTKEGESAPEINDAANSITGGDVSTYRWWYKQRASNRIKNLKTMNDYDI